MLLWSGIARTIPDQVNKETYAFKTSSVGNDYFFVSEGKFGEINKQVSISRIQSSAPVEVDELYNLAFGDLKRIRGKLVMDDSVRSSNGDMPKVLATVAKIAIAFMKENKEATLAFEGFWDDKSSELGRNQRTILYQRAINSNWSELISDFNISGIKDGLRVDYTPGVNYDVILIKHK
jgi:hypothetical protein